MSIESNLKSIAESLAVIAQHLANPMQAVDAAPVAAPPAPPVAPVVEAPPVAAPPAAVTMTVDELNAGLVAEYKRLGNDRTKITAVMGAPPFNAVSISDLTPDQYAPLLTAVQAVTQATLA